MGQQVLQRCVAIAAADVALAHEQQDVLPRLVAFVAVGEPLLGQLPLERRSQRPAFVFDTQQHVVCLLADAVEGRRLTPAKEDRVGALHIGRRGATGAVTGTGTARREQRQSAQRQGDKG